MSRVFKAPGVGYWGVGGQQEDMTGGSGGGGVAHIRTHGRLADKQGKQLKDGCSHPVKDGDEQNRWWEGLRVVWENVYECARGERGREQRAARAAGALSVDALCSKKVRFFLLVVFL